MFGLWPNYLIDSFIRLESEAIENSQSYQFSGADNIMDGREVSLCPHVGCEAGFCSA